MGGVLAGTEIPAGTELHIRLTSKVSSKESKPKDSVTAVIITPVFTNGQVAIASGTTLHGTVKAVKPYAPPDQKASLTLEFSELKDKAGVSAKVKLVEPKTVQRFEGKAKRVIDKRTI